MLKCGHCHLEKPESEFSKRVGKRGYDYRCKACVYAYQQKIYDPAKHAQHYQRNREKVIAYYKERYHNDSLYRERVKAYDKNRRAKKKQNYSSAALLSEVNIFGKDTE